MCDVCVLDVYVRCDVCLDVMCVLDVCVLDVMCVRCDVCFRCLCVLDVSAADSLRREHTHVCVKHTSRTHDTSTHHFVAALTGSISECLV